MACTRVSICCPWYTDMHELSTRAWVMCPAGMFI